MSQSQQRNEWVGVKLPRAPIGRVHRRGPLFPVPTPKCISSGTVESWNNDNILAQRRLIYEGCLRLRKALENGEAFVDLARCRARFEHLAGTVTVISANKH